MEAVVPHLSCELLDLDTHPTELATEVQGDQIELSILLVLALPVLGIGPGGPEEGQAPHQEVGKVGEGGAHQWCIRPVLCFIFPFSRYGKHGDLGLPLL